MISFKPFFETMKRKGITTYKLFNMGFSVATYYRIKEGKGANSSTIGELCKLLDCTVSEIIEYIPDENKKT